MLSVKICRPDTGAAGYITELDLSPLSTKYRVTNIDGIDYVDSNILSDKVSQHYGSIYRGWSVADREITIDIVPIGDIQTNRRELLSFFNQRDIYRIELIDGVHNIADPTDLPELSLAWINGYVRAIDYQNFAKQESIKLIFVCPYPYFTRLKANTPASAALQVLFGIPAEIAERRSLFPIGFSVRGGQAGIFGTNSTGERTLTFSFSNPGEVESGIVFVAELLVTGAVKIGEFKTKPIGPDIIIIDTRPTYKAVYSYDNGILTPLNNKIDTGGKWTVARPGDNSINVTLPVPTSGSSRTYALLSYAPEYEGI